MNKFENGDMRDLLKELRAAINEALEDVAQRHGLESLRAGNASFTHEGAFTLKLEGLVKGGVSKEAKAYDLLVKYGEEKLPPLGTIFHRHGKAHEIVGATPRGKVITQVLGGSRYAWEPNSIENLTGYLQRKEHDHAI